MILLEYFESLGFVSVLVILFIYFIPSINGWNKKHIQSIFWINLIFGWTVIGWIGALIWSFNSPLEEKYMPYGYECGRCGLKKRLEESLKMMKCPQCGKENYYE